MKNANIYLIILVYFVGFNLYAQRSFVVEKQGRGQPLLVFPGFTCTGEVFKEMTQELSDNYEVHVFTFAGFGDVPPIEFPWLPKIKQDIQEYVKENNLKNAIIIGHSMGGTLGLWLAAENNNYEKLILIDALPAIGALMIPNYDSKEVIYESAYNQQLLAMDTVSFRKMAQQTAGVMCIDKTKHAQLIDWIMQADRKTYVYGYTDLLKQDLRPELKNIKIPVHIIAATHPYGKEMVDLNFKNQYRNLENYQLIFAENSGHFIMYDKPEWFLEQMKKIVDKDE